MIVQLNDTLNCGHVDCRVQKLLTMPHNLPAILWPQVLWRDGLWSVYVKTPHGGTHARSFWVCPVHHGQLLATWEQVTAEEIAEQEADIAYHLREEGSYDQGETEGDLLHRSRGGSDLQGDRVDGSRVVQSGGPESQQTGASGVAR